MAEVNKDEVDKEPPLIVVDEAERAAHEAAAREEKEDDADEPEDKDDERLGKGRDETEEDIAARGNETDEQRRERNRRNKKEKKLRQQQAIERDKREKNYLEQRNEQLERKLIALEKGQTVTQAMAVDGRISQVQDQLREAEALYAQAVEANAGSDVVEIQKIRDHLEGQLKQLKGYKEHLAKGGPVAGKEEEQSTERRERTVRPTQDPEISRRSQDFQNNLVWFDPKATDPDSAVVYAIDVALAKEGKLNPRGPKYWAELERRVKAALPHKFVGDDDRDADDDDDEAEEPTPRKNGKPGGPRMPTGGDRGTKGGSNTFFISKERKDALIELGVWDDPKLRAKYVKKYREWDQQNAGSK